MSTVLSAEAPVAAATIDPTALPLKREACLIAGEWVMGDRWTTISDPASGEPVGRVPQLGARHAARAIEAAEASRRDWAARPAKERADVLREMAALMSVHAGELAGLLTAEQGKPLVEARSEIEHAASFLEWFGEEARRAGGEIVPTPSSDRRILVLRQPVGVVAAITPWNFPSAMITRKIAPALAAGCGVVVKPAPQTPFSALALGVISELAGLPKGLLNIVTGPAEEIGAELTSNPLVRKISFTGSTAVGSKLFAQSAPTIKKLSLELGGNAAFIVFDDADLDAAVEGAMRSKFRNAGQTCICANRIYVQAGIHDAFVDRLVAATRKLNVGPGSAQGVDVGPLVDAAAIAKVEAHVTDACARGATIAGRAEAPATGLFFPPTVLRGATDDMLIAREETFGPVAPVFRFDDESEVIDRANATETGLAAYVFTRDLSRTIRVAEALEAGIVGVNTGLVSTEVAPFGGIKQSGLGREGSRHGIEDYQEIKYVCVGVEPAAARRKEKQA